MPFQMPSFHCAISLFPLMASQGLCPRNYFPFLPFLSFLLCQVFLSSVNTYITVSLKKNPLLISLPLPSTASTFSFSFPQTPQCLFLFLPFSLFPFPLKMTLVRLSFSHYTIKTVLMKVANKHSCCQIQWSIHSFTYLLFN